MNEEILRVTPDGEFIWHDNADNLIKTGDFSGSPPMPHILRRLRQRDALLEALHAIVRRVNDAASYRMGSDIDALARAAIKAVEEGK